MHLSYSSHVFDQGNIVTHDLFHRCITLICSDLGKASHKDFCSVCFSYFLSFPHGICMPNNPDPSEEDKTTEIENTRKDGA